MQLCGYLLTTVTRTIQKIVAMIISYQPLVIGNLVYCSTIMSKTMQWMGLLCYYGTLCVGKTIEKKGILSNNDTSLILNTAFKII